MNHAQLRLRGTIIDVSVGILYLSPGRTHLQNKTNTAIFDNLNLLLDKLHLDLILFVKI